MVTAGERPCRQQWALEPAIVQTLHDACRKPVGHRSSSPQTYTAAKLLLQRAYHGADCRSLRLSLNVWPI